MAMINLPANERFYQVAQRIVEAVWQHDDSLFAPGQPIWSLTTINKFYQVFVENPDLSSNSFEAKLADQLATADPATILLAAELLYIHLLPADGIKAETKRSQIRQVLQLANPPIVAAIPADLNQVLDHGIAKAGMAFLIHKHAQMSFLLSAVRQWKLLPADQRPDLADPVDGPWAFKQFLVALPIQSAYAQREILLHLIFPETFEAMMSREHKRLITTHYAALVDPGTSDIDRRLLQIRQRLEPTYGARFNFYDPRVKRNWDGGGNPEPLLHPALPRSLGTKLRPYVQLAALLNDSAYTAQQIVNLLGQIRPPIADLSGSPQPQQVVRDLACLRLLETLDDGRYRRWPGLADATLADMLRYAALTMLLPAGDEYLLPVVEAPFDGLPHPAEAWPLAGAILPWYAEAGLVQELANGTWQGHSAALTPLTGSTPTIRTLNAFLEQLQQVRNSQDGLPALEDTPLTVLAPAILEQRIAEIQRELLIERSTILRIYRSLLAGQHVILSGPPGTGKTHLARILPSILWRDAEPHMLLRMPADPELPADTPAIPEPITREGYAVDVVTATEDWGVRHVIGGITPQLQQQGSTRSLVYAIRHGHLTRTVLSNYQGYTGDGIPTGLLRQEQIDQQGRRYRGRWLVIDEFTRAQIDAAFGSLLTTLGGQQRPTIAVPTDDGGEQHVPLPRDFRLIGTLNSFDRHFLNQISEAMKRRFAFIDILPPSRELAEAEQGMALFNALERLSRNQLAAITADRETGQAQMPGILSVVRSDPQQPLRALSYQITFDDPQAQAALASFWRIFSAIRIYRQLGTAQAEAVYAALLAGQSIGLTWANALDAALADTLADQLQVLARDEQRVLLAVVALPHDPGGLRDQILATLERLPGPRQSSHLAQLKAHVASIDPNDPKKLSSEQVQALFGSDLATPAMLAADGLFASRLRAFAEERGL
ncbi:MAG: hypothetical protein Fur005_34110 [Roseiflexaceae bacterium]